MRRVLILSCITFFALSAQEPNPTQQLQSAPSDDAESAPLYRVDVVAKTTQAVNYEHRGLPTKVDFEGTVFLPEAEGKARVEAKKGAVEIQGKFKNLASPQRFGLNYLTYVLWALTPEGRAENLGELVTDGEFKAKLETAAELQTFALLVTAEPYYAVTQPSDVVVLENVIRPETIGQVQTVDAKYELLRRSAHRLEVAEARRYSARDAKKVPLDQAIAQRELYQARNAIQFAEAQGAAQFAPDSLEKAQQKLQEAEARYASHPKSKQIVTLAREATQTAEDARLITLRRKEARAEESQGDGSVAEALPDER